MFDNIFAAINYSAQCGLNKISKYEVKFIINKSADDKTELRPQQQVQIKGICLV